MDPVTLLLLPVYAVKAALGVGSIAIAMLTIPLSYLGGLANEGKPIDEPIHIVDGIYYSSIKVDIPFTKASCWYYAGDEVEHDDEVDEDTFAFRCNSKFGATKNLKGNESKP